MDIVARVVGGDAVKQPVYIIAHPGASQSTCDVEAGLFYGLQYHGIKVWRYRLDMLLQPAKHWCRARYLGLRKHDPSIAKPTKEQEFYQAGIDLLGMALRHEADAVIVVSFMLLHPDVVVMMRRAGLKVYAVFTETPYDMDEELVRAGLVDGCWTNERTAVSAFKAVQRNSGYLPHGWHPERHKVGLQPDDEKVPAHDVVFVGTMFNERIAWLDSMNWDGIDLGLYGNLEMIPSRHRLRKFCKGAQISNRTAAALYRRAKIGLNLYRDTPAGLPPAESLNPRAYELAACGVFALSPERKEGKELFGSLVPAPTEAAIREWLRNAEGRAHVQALLPATVANASWVTRAERVIGDLQMLDDLHRLQRAG
jgi:hypothetical protein